MSEIVFCDICDSSIPDNEDSQTINGVTWCSSCTHLDLPAREPTLPPAIGVIASIRDIGRTSPFHAFVFAYSIIGSPLLQVFVWPTRGRHPMAFGGRVALRMMLLVLMPVAVRGLGWVDWPWLLVVTLPFFGLAAVVVIGMTVIGQLLFFLALPGALVIVVCKLLGIGDVSLLWAVVVALSPCLVGLFNATTQIVCAPRV